MKSELTLETLRKIHRELMKNAIPPRMVKSKLFAAYLTAIDPAERVWRIGDTYYIARRAR